MHPSVASAFTHFSTEFEGRFAWPYLDIEGFVTVGVGCLIDPIELALPLPWVHFDGSVATHEEVVAQWRDLKAQVRLAKTGARFAEHVTSIRLSDEAIESLLSRRLNANEAVLEQQFLRWDLFPADAQLAIHSMSWAMGPGFTKEFPKFTRACNAQDWVTALAECTIAGESTNAGLIRRNADNRLCLANAQAVKDDINHAGHGRGTHALSLDKLYWPARAGTDTDHSELSPERT
jgi:GH24 family phage-related lysozyme (muramidase)